MIAPPDERLGLPSCSALDRLANCPASFLLGKAAGAAGLVPPAGGCADSGTRIHRFLETNEDADFEALTNDERETADICRNMRDRVIIEWVAPSGPNMEHYREQRLGLTRLGNVLPVVDAPAGAAFVVTGMADHVVVDGANRRGCIIDFKTGRGEVDDAKDNAQLRGLAVLVAGRYNLDSVRVAIIQPLAGAPTVADYDADSLCNAGIWLELVCEEIYNDHDPRAGDWCQYCPARAACPALREVATDIPVEASPAVYVAKAIDLTSADLSAALRGRRMIGWYLHAIEAAAKMRIERGEVIPGWEMREKSGRRKIIDTDKAVAVLAPLLARAEGGAQAALLRCATLRPNSLQEEIQFASGKKSARLYNMTQKDAKQHLANALGDLLEVPKVKELVETGAVIDGGEGDE